ncbi:hypothetical protein SAMN02745181_0543 [Rubritalea squalenifaciens DSM 18772]|uniref:Glycosyl transferase family 2 n=1 Tax=Rubritalea squalenifaciens DSM 18772 TaxID=1123071 RepID=A0A1M6CRL9_9BACT|nr:hypothetical protein [Rubritalea squalenifaciens]SHI63378.1 hypothetical protein SAMN02745181_0543 [Rubritalea squalenifaciens DSM 18772]
MTKLSIVWFSYRPHFEFLVESVRCAASTFPEATLHVVSDSTNPFTGDQVTELETMGVRVKQSSTARNGNLNGCDWALTQMQYLADVPGECVVKVDSDTLLLGREWLDPLLSGAVDAVGFQSSGPRRRAWYGAVYALRVSLLPALAAEVGEYYQFPLGPEDIMIGMASKRLCGSRWLVRGANRNDNQGGSSLSFFIIGQSGVEQVRGAEAVCFHVHRDRKRVSALMREVRRDKHGSNQG